MDWRRAAGCCQAAAIRGSSFSTCGAASCTRSRPTTHLSNSAFSPRPRGSPPAISSSDRSTPSVHAPCAPTDPSARMHEKYFERRQIKEAIAFAEEGGVAVHRNFDSYHGSTIRGMVREKPFLHVIGLRPVLEEWGRRH